MRTTQVCLESIVGVIPEEVVTSLELEARLEPVYRRFNLHPGRLELMTGIRERRFWEPGTMPSDAATRAGHLALQQAGVEAHDIGLLVHTAVSRDFLEPATAAVVHRNLQLSSEAGFFDISNACLGFLNGLMTVAHLIELKHIRRGLVVAGESGRQLVDTTVEALRNNPRLTRRDLKDAFASLTIGSGAAAAVLSHESVTGSRHRLLGGVVRAATQHHELCRGSSDTGFGESSAMLMNTDSEALLQAGCQLAGETWQHFKKTLGWSDEQVDRCFTHQVGTAHRQRLYEVIGRDEHRDFATLEFMGNVGSVSLPLTAALGLREFPPSAGERMALLGIGSGLSCMMLGLEW